MNHHKSDGTSSQVLICALIPYVHSLPSYTKEKMICEQVEVDTQPELNHSAFYWYNNKIFLSANKLLKHLKDSRLVVHFI